MTDIKVTLDPDGANIVMIAGDALRDNGVENRTNFPLMTKDGHWSEDFETNPDSIYQGNYLKTNPLPITRDNLITKARAAEADLAGPPFGEILAEVTNPVGQQEHLEVLIKPINSNPFILSQTKNGENYLNQITGPASAQILPKETGSGVVYRYKELLTKDGDGLTTNIDEQLMVKVKE